MVSRAPAKTRASKNARARKIQISKTARLGVTPRSQGVVKQRDKEPGYPKTRHLRLRIPRRKKRKQKKKKREEDEPASDLWVLAIVLASLPGSTSTERAERHKAGKAKTKEKQRNREMKGRGVAPQRKRRTVQTRKQLEAARPSRSCFRHSFSFPALALSPSPTFFPVSLFVPIFLSRAVPVWRLLWPVHRTQKTRQKTDR